MKKYSILLAAAAVFAAVSCEKEAPAPEEIAPAGEQTQTTEEQTLTNPITITFSANAETKVSLLEGEGTSGAKTAVWDENDRVTIIWFNSAESKMKTDTVKVDFPGKAYTTFTARVEKADYYYAIYPATIDATLDGKGNFTVNFPDNRTLTDSFADAAWYAAKTTKTDKSFVFHPVSTVIKFIVDGSKSGSPTHVYFRGMSGGGNYRGITPITFANEDGYPITIGTPTGDDAKANVTGLINGSGTYYLSLPASGQTTTNGFILQLKKSGVKTPAAYYSANIVQTPGKFYNIKAPVDNKIIKDYYVAPESSSEAGNPTLEGYGTSSSNPATYTWLQDNIAAFKFYDTMSAAFILNGTTIHLMGSATSYDTPLSTMFPTANRDNYSYTIQGGEGEGKTTFTTSATSSFGNAKATVLIKDLTFSGCTTAPALTVSSGNVTLNNVVFTSCAAKAIDVTGGKFTYNNGDVSNCSAASAIVISNDPTVSLNKVTLSGNNDGAAKINGAALRIAPSSTASVNLDNCLFIENKAGAGVGGAIYHNGTSANLELKDCKFISNSCTGNSGGAISAANTVTGHIYITGCLFYGNTTGTQYGSAIHCANKKTSEQVFLGVNNSLFYNNGSVQGTNKADGNSTLVICGKHVIMNSTLIATSNIIIRTGYNNGGEADHTNYGGSLLLNNVISNESTNAVHSALNTVNTKYTLRCNGYNYYSSIKNQVQVSPKDIICALSKDTNYTWTPSSYDWTWTPNAAQKTSMASYETLRALISNDQYNDANSDVHDDSSAFLSWLESLEYEYNSIKYNAFQVDINGRPRNVSAYWPGCYQND